MSITPNLVFFNKQGYPYNFTLNESIWTGKIFFDPNSTDTFKSLTLYTLENVNEIEYTDTFNIINKEIYNDSGMTLSSGNYTNKLVTDILKVNQSPDFYTKWIYGKDFNKFFPKGTIISFSGDIIYFQLGGSDFLSKYFTVLQTVKDAIMIATTTPNNLYSFIYSGKTFYVNSHDCISIPDADQNLQTEFNILPNEKVSVVGTNNGLNDGVYEVSGTSYTTSRIFDYNLSGLTNPGDIIYTDLTLLTERPLLYQGQILISDSGGTISATFIGGRNSNIIVGTKFICEDSAGNHLLLGNEYKVSGITTENYICTPTGMTFGIYTYEEDDGTTENIYTLRMSETYNIEVGWNIRFDSNITNYKNNRLIKKVTDIVSGVTYSGETAILHYDFYLDSFVASESGVTYSIVHMLKSHEQNTVIVESSIDNSIYNGYAIVLSTSNKIRYTQEVLSGTTSIIDTIDVFINKYSSIFEFNGIDIYRKNETLIFDGRYSGSYKLNNINPYFKIDLFINTTPISITEGYSINSSGDTYFYNIILKPCDITYERLNMSNDLSLPYSADIILDLFDDNQNFGFQLTINGIQYYIPFNNNSGTTSYTLETIKDFITKYYNIFYYNGINIYSGTTISGTTTINHIYINGQEPNVDIWEMKVKVNKNSSYSINEVQDRCMMVTANKIESDIIDFTDIDFATGMIVSVSGSTYPMNNKEFNIIGLNANPLKSAIELSYQGPLSGETNVTLTLKTRKFLRRPRETNDSDIIYRFRWETDSSTNTLTPSDYVKYPSIFLYDLSGENLIPYGNNPLYAYNGPKPLVANGDMVFLNKEPNKLTENVSIPYKQQTIFDQLNFTLQRFDDDNASILPNPIQTFIGYNTNIEGVDQRNLIIERVDNIIYSGSTDGISLYFNIEGSSIHMISGNTSFLDLGFKVGRYLRMKFNDNKIYTQEVFEDYQDFLIKDVTNTKITVDGTLTTFTTLNEDYDFEFLLLPERIAYFRIYGETEAEDERLEANMKLLGISLTEEDEFIFKQSDVTEDGIDYRLLNRKRKEMMNVYPEIYNYIGSYRAILNSIDFFGYSDIELVEYYRNINKTSPYYRKLKRVVIPDLLDRQVEGWNYSENTPSPLEYVKTNLLNLTYRITDEEGNNVYLFTLKEVQTKLNGLKHWLRRNVIPVNVNVRDITGVSECVNTTWRRFDPGTNFQKNITSQSNEAININYTATRNFNDNWLVSCRFYVINSGNTPKYWDLKVITFKKDPLTGLLYPQQRWDDMRTDLSNFNFTINWDGTSNDNNYDRFFYVQTTAYNDYGVAKTMNKMYRLEDGVTYYFDEFKNYTLVNNNFRYKTFGYAQNLTDVYIMDGDGNFWVVNKEIQANRI
jgi:hypothetical protein